MSFTSRSSLHRVLWLDTLTSSLMTLSLLVLSAPLSTWFGLPQTFLLTVGALLVPWCIGLGVLASRTTPNATAVRGILFGNAVWVLASVVFLASNLWSPTPFGQAFIAIQAAVVAGVIWLQYTGSNRAQALSGGTA